MRKVDLGSAILYGVFTAFSLALVLVFMQFLADRTGGISLAILIAGGAASGLIVAYMILRWYLSIWLGREIRQRVGQVFDLGAEFSSDDAAPLLRRDIKKVVEQTRALGPDLWQYARSAVAVIAFMAVTVELLALANAAVMYLQAQRIEEQNQLLEIQNRAQLAVFLNDVLSSVGTTNAILDDARRVRNVISEDLLPAFDVIDAFVTDVTNGQVEMSEFLPAVCTGEPEDCDQLALQELTELLASGSVLVADDNAAAMRGYARLAKAAELVLQALTADFQLADLNLSESTTAFGDAIADALATCGSEHVRGSVPDLWEGVSGVGYGATAMFDAVDDVSDDIRPGMELSLLQTDAYTIAAGVGIIAQALGRNDDLTEGPQGAAVLFAEGIRRLRDELVSLVDTCDSYQLQLERTMAFLNAERARVLDEIGEPNAAE